MHGAGELDPIGVNASFNGGLARRFVRQAAAVSADMPRWQALTCHLLLRDLERMLSDSLTVAVGSAGSSLALRELAHVIHECQQRLRIGRELVGLFAGGLGDPIKDALGFVQLNSTRCCHCSEPVGVVVIDGE